VTDPSDRGEARRRAGAWERVSREQYLLHADSEAAAGWGREHPEAFGGLWFDNDDAEAGVGAVRIAVAVRARTSQVVVHSLRSRLQHPDRLTLVPCEFSMRELEAALRCIRDRHMPDRRSRGRGAHVTTLSLDIRRNRIEVGLSERDDDKARGIADEFAGFPVVFVHGVRVEPVARGL
jgi:hypothetical protein